MSRPRKEVDQDYSQNAIMYGHKKRMIDNLETDITRLENECRDHLKKLVALNEEGMKLPPEPVVPSPPPPESSL